MTLIVRLLPPAALFLGAAVFAFDGAAQAAHATKLTSISPAHCVATLERNERGGRSTDFVALQLPRETRAYVPKLLAISRLVAVFCVSHAV